MTRREDGKKTRCNLLNAACDIFAQKGYRDTKVADICERAGANVAAVNYHFGDKASLYKETWQYAFQNYDEPAPSEPVTDSPQDLLLEYIQTREYIQPPVGCR